MEQKLQEKLLLIAIGVIVIIISISQFLMQH